MSLTKGYVKGRELQLYDPKPDHKSYALLHAFEYNDMEDGEPMETKVDLSKFNWERDIYTISAL